MIKQIFILILLSSIAHAEGGNTQMTPLDIAYVDAVKNGGTQSEFYNIFLNSELFIPTHEVPEKDQLRRAGEGESISPIFIESNGIQHLMLFDTKERLSTWAQREVGFVALPGHAIVEMMSGEFHWALNVGTEQVKIFESDEIEWLKQMVAHSKVKTKKITLGTEVLVGAPAKIPDGLIESLIKNLSSRNKEVKRAYLGQVFYVKEDEIPHLVLVLDTGKLPESIIEVISHDLAIASNSFIGESEYIDIMVNNNSGIAKAVTNAVQPFYVSEFGARIAN